VKQLYRWIFGDVVFPRSEEYDEFRYKFLIVLMLCGALFTAVFVVGEFLQINRIQTPHLLSMQLFTLAALGLWGVLRGRKHLFNRIAWTYEIVCLMEYTSSLWLVPADELRLMWFFVNVPGVFILLGSAAGWFITLLTIVWLVVSNAVMPVAYSGNAMTTFIFSMLDLGVFFHVYGARSMSYFVRMRDTNQELERLASHDMLTGVLNARAYYAACEQQIGSAARTGHPYAVLFIDLDHFKSINDTHGHAAGDAVLRAVARCMQQAIRRSDVLGRIGGEEFSVFMPNTARSGALQLAESLRHAVETLEPSIGERTLHITASIGLAVCEGDGEPMQAIQKRADQAMYTAKKLGRNRVSSIDEDATSGIENGANAV
jgi:diguanylate cyclase (GGDEF)-like protein